MFTFIIITHLHLNVHIHTRTQDDIFWEDLNVQEHLLFQCRQRCIPTSRIRGEAQRVAMVVGLDGDAFRTPAGCCTSDSS